jgi:hypothetical protein
MKKAKIIIIYILLFLPICIKAQVFTLKGTIVESANKPVEMATVRILDIDSVLVSGAITDPTGKFSINLQKKGNYILSVNCLGFQNVQINLQGIESSIDVGSIILKESENILHEIVVTANQQINKSEKSIFFPTYSQIKHSSDGFGLLNNIMIPQIDIDLLKKRVTSRGNNVTLLINGRPITDYSEITALRPKDIVRIEYHDMPTGTLAEYETVIDYITRNYSSGGYVGMSGTQQMTYGNGDYLGMARMNHHNSEYSLGYSFDYLNNEKKRRDISETFIYPNNDILYRTETGLPSLEKKHTNHLFFNFNNKTDFNQTNVKIGYKNKQIPENEILSALSYKGLYNYSKNLVDISSERQSNPYLSFYSKFKLKNEQTFYIRGSVDYSKNYYNRFYEENQENGTADSLYSRVNENYVYTVLGSGYTKNFSKGRAIALNITNYTAVSKSSYDGEIISKEKLVTNESVFLLDLSKKWEKIYLSLRLGGSALYYYQKENKHYWSYRPGLTFRYIPNEKNMFQYRGVLANSWPTLELFTDTEQNIDLIQKRKGNPSLEIVKILNNRITYSYTSNRFNWNIILDQYHSYPNIKNRVYYDGNYFIQTYINNGSYKLFSPGFGIGLKLLKNNLNVKVNGGVYLYSETGDNSSQETDWYINPSMIFLYKNFNFNLFYNSSRKGLYASLMHWTKRELYGLSASYNKEGVSLTLGMQNPFSKYTRTGKTNLGIYSSQSYFYDGQNDHLFYVMFNYNFSFGKKHQYSDIDSNKSSNSAIIKGSKE